MVKNNNGVHSNLELRFSSKQFPLAIRTSDCRLWGLFLKSLQHIEPLGRDTGLLITVLRCLVCASHTLYHPNPETETHFPSLDDI